MRISRRLILFSCREMRDIMKEKVAVSKRLSENIAQMEEFFHECDDIKKEGIDAWQADGCGMLSDVY